MIELRDVTASYINGENNNTVIKNVSGVIPSDTVVAIMGKSGSGKTTLLKVIGSLMSPVSGEVLFNGENIYLKDDMQKCLFRREKVGFIYQSYDLLPELTVYENIMLPLLLNKKKPNKQAIINLCKEIEIDHLLKKFPFEISGGEQQRTAIARAVIHGPELLLCDEPTGNLDENTSNIIITTIRKLQTNLHATLVIVTHDEDIAAKADHILHIRDGILEDNFSTGGFEK